MKNLGIRPTGTMGEFAAMLLVPEARLTRKKSHDLRARKTYIEVKAGRARKGGDWIFNLKYHQKRWSPVFALVCFERGNSWKIERFYLVNRENLLGRKSIWIKNGEFEEFRVY